MVVLRSITPAIFVIVCMACGAEGRPAIIVEEGKTIQERFNPPKGYSRVSYNKLSFAHYLASLPLKPYGTPVTYYDGSVKMKKNVYLSVVDFDIDPVNLQQCADAVMRLRAEYLYSNKAYNEIQFTFGNGFKASYSEWMKGKRIVVTGNRAVWKAAKRPSNDYRSFRKYLLTVFTYAGTASLVRDLVHVKKISDIETGDVFLKPGSPGHAVIVVDTALNAGKRKVFILAQSYMPAQDIQILENPSDSGISPWYEIPEGKELETPEWNFSVNELMRFPAGKSSAGSD